MSSREKNLLAILGVIFVSYLFYNFLLSPSMKKYDEALVNLQKKEAEIIEMKGYEDEIEKMENHIKENEGIYESISVNYFVGYMQANLGMDMDKLIKAAGIDVSSIDVTKPSYKRLGEGGTSKVQGHESVLDLYYAQYKGQQITEEKGEKKSEPLTPLDVEMSSINLNFTGEFKQIIAFIKSIEEYPKKLLIDNIAFNTSSEEGDEFTVVMTLTAYMMPGEIDENLHKFLEPGKRDNPFAANGADNTDYYSGRNVDFHLLLKPSSSDINTMSLNTKDGGMEGLISIDSEGEESAAIHIKMQDGKPVYRYSFGKKASYPKEAEKYVPLTMNNEGFIYLKVDSQKRNNNDNNKVNMRIINDTNIPFYFKVYRDDKLNPRFNIKELIGDVQEDK